jgi:hypothetical protein
VALRIRETPEPLSLASYDLQRDSLVIGSNASRLLIQELRRYCRREITGRSFLISGHRGAGKTTLVNSAILESWKESERSGTQGRPLFVPIHGPSLFRMAGGKDSAAPLDPASEEVLKQTILCLHRAVAHEVASAFRRRVIETAPTERQRREGLELAAQLAVELYECPGPMRLREIWSRGGFLDGSNPGVLFRNGGEDQGVRELVAISGACEAFRRISGTYQSKETTEDAAKTKAEAALGTEAGKDLFGPILSLLTGGLVGVGAHALAEAGGIEATLAGILGALGASTVFKISGSRSRDRSVSRERTFLFDFTVATLDRALLILIGRLQDAGLAPVFVVDELDKVEHLSERILWMVHYLKKLVAEHAFFCFLTDRGYYEEMIQRGESHPYPVEYTYFMHRLFVVFQPRDFHAYLDSVLELPKPAASVAPEAEAAQTALIVQDGLVAEDRTDRIFLRYVLLHQSQMHALDLQRQLAALRGAHGTVVPAGKALRDRPAFKVAVVMQLAIDMTFDGPELADRISREPEFGRLVNDAMYYLSRRWREAPGEDLSLTNDDEAAFGEYLEKRMGREEDARPGAAVSDRDRRFLFQLARELAFTLAVRPRYEQCFQVWNDFRVRSGRERLDSSVLDALPEEGPPLLFLPDEKSAYRWLYDVDGREVQPAESVQAEPKGLALEVVAPPQSDWKPAVTFINDFAQALTELAGEVDLSTLSSHLRIISTSPAWPTVQVAITDLQLFESHGQPYDDLQNDIRCVQQYARLLEGRAETIACALVCGLVVGMASDMETRGRRILVGLDVISRAHRFSEKTDAEVAETLKKLLQDVRHHPGLSTLMANCPDLSWKGDLKDWSTRLGEAFSKLGQETLNTLFMIRIDDYSWDSWLRRLDLFFQGARQPEPELNDLLALAAQVPAARLFKPDLREMTVGDWSAVLIKTVLIPPLIPPFPLWAAVAALLALGFNDSWIDLILVEVSKARSQEPKGLAWDRWQAWRRFMPGRSQCSVLVLKRAEKSAVEGWVPSPSTAALVLSADLASDLIRGFDLSKASFRPETRLDLCGFEMPLEPPDLDTAVLKFAQSLPAPPPSGLYIYAETPRAAPLTPYVIAPKSADELFPTPA